MACRTELYPLKYVCIGNHCICDDKSVMYYDMYYCSYSRAPVFCMYVHSNKKKRVCFEKAEKFWLYIIYGPTLLRFAGSRSAGLRSTHRAMIYVVKA